jgi:hypothetical protein
MKYILDSYEYSVEMLCGHTVQENTIILAVIIIYFAICCYY